MQPYLELGGVEIVSSDRALAYAARCGCVTLIEVCECEITPGQPYTDPESDEAPWVHTEASDSTSFQGVFVTDLELSAVPTRSVTPVNVGGVVGRMRPRHRIVTVSGLLIADAECGLEYGRRWLTDALAGGWRVEGCAADELRFLSCCPEDLSVLFEAEAVWKASEYEDDDSHWRDLSGNGHDARLGSTVGADENDPLYLRPDNGTQYAYFPGTDGNAVSSPDVPNLRGSFDLRGRIRRDADDGLISQRAGGSDQTWVFSYHTTLPARLQFVMRQGGANTSVNSTVVVPSGHDFVRVTRDEVSGDVTFFSSSDGETWTQLGDVVNSVTGLLDASTAVTQVGRWQPTGTENVVRGKYFWVEIRDGINGTIVASPDFTDRDAVTEPFQSFTDPQDNLWTPNRSDAGRKLEIVNQSRFLYGTDDEMTVADHPALNPGSDPFTLAVLVRVYNATPPADEVMIGKKSSGVLPEGYQLFRDTTGALRFRVSDGANASTTPSTPMIPIGVDTVLVGVRDADTLRVFIDGVEQASADASSVGEIANALPFRMGRQDDVPSYANMTQSGAAFFRRALSSEEITRVAEDLRS